MKTGISLGSEDNNLNRKLQSGAHSLKDVLIYQTVEDALKLHYGKCRIQCHLVRPFDFLVVTHTSLPAGWKCYRNYDKGLLK